MEIKLNELISRCQSETERFRRGEPSDTQACWEIWRRAVVNQDDAAWQAVVEQYTYLVHGWLRARMRTLPWLRQEENMLVNVTFAKFHHAVNSQKFESFTNLPMLLSYLGNCCSSAVVDEQRDYMRRIGQVSLNNSSQQTDDAADQGGSLGQSIQLATAQNLEEDAIAKSSRLEFWQRVKQLLRNKDEELLLELYYILQMPPREITKFSPKVFPTVEDVYRRHKNLLSRLRSNTDLLPRL